MLHGYQLLLKDEQGNLYPVSPEEDNLLDYDLDKPLARIEVIDQIQNAIDMAEIRRVRGSL